MAIMNTLCLVLSNVQLALAFRAKLGKLLGEYANSSHLQATCSNDFQNVLRRVAVKELFQPSKEVKIGRILKKRSYRHQWEKTAAKVQFIEGARYVNGSTTMWEDILLFDGYAYERQRLQNLGRTSENIGHLLQESKVQSICDLAPATLKSLLMSSRFLQAIQSQTDSDECKEYFALQHLHIMIRSSLESMCFSECLADLSEHSLACNAEIDQETFSSIYANLGTHCTKLPYDLLEETLEYVMHKKCYDFPPLSFLWGPDDKGAGSLAMRDDNPTCTPPHPHDKRHWLNEGLKIEIDMQRGMCPEGTRCKCLYQSLRERPSVADLRGNQGNRVFVNRGIASAASIASQFAMGFLVSTFVVNMAIGGASLSSALLASLQVPTFLAVGSVILSVQSLIAVATFSCEQTLGCWPSSTMHVDGRGCRVKATAKYGGSPLWFLPPPATKLHKTNAGCVIEACEPAEYKQQRVGFSKLRSADLDDYKNMSLLDDYWRAPDAVVSDAREAVFNCQPLNYEAMSREQRTKMVNLLKSSGMEEEYTEDLHAVDDA